MGANDELKNRGPLYTNRKIQKILACLVAKYFFIYFYYDWYVELDKYVSNNIFI